MNALCSTCCQAINASFLISPFDQPGFFLIILIVSTGKEYYGCSIPDKLSVMFPRFVVTVKQV